MSDREPHGDRGRSFENAVLLIGFVGWVVAGVWLLMTMADVRKAQDCAGQGRRNCGTLELPERAR